MDVTWDDPVPDRYGLVQHNNILLSDKAIKKNGHTDWSFAAESVKCTDSTYDNYFWKNVTSPFVHYDKNWYYMAKNGQKVSLFRTDFNEANYMLTEYEEFGHNGCYSGLALWYGVLVFNTSEHIILYSPHSGNTKIIYDDMSDNCIYGIMAGDNVSYNLNIAPDMKNQNILKLDTPIPGDADLNGILNAKDITILIRHLGGYESNAVSVDVDVDLDGILSIKDANISRRIVVNKY